MSDNSIREVPFPSTVHVASDASDEMIQWLLEQGYRVVVTPARPAA